MSNIVWGIKDKAYPPMPHKAIHKLLAAEASNKHFPGEYTVISAESSNQLVLERQLHHITTTLLTTEVTPRIKQVPKQSDDKTVSFKSTKTVDCFIQYGVSKALQMITYYYQELSEE